NTVERCIWQATFLIAISYISYLPNTGMYSLALSSNLNVDLAHPVVSQNHSLIRYEGSSQVTILS
ncbi:hypothetical protein AB5N96_13210, partial [Chryseomicrobium imtechense]